MILDYVIHHEDLIHATNFENIRSLFELINYIENQDEGGFK
jgi:hypothetical protein